MKIKFQTVVLSALLLFGLTSATTEMFFADTWAGTASNQGLTFNALYNICGPSTPRLFYKGTRINNTNRLITQNTLQSLNVVYSMHESYRGTQTLSVYSSLPVNDDRVVTKNDIEIGAIAYSTPKTFTPGFEPPAGEPVMRYSSRNASGQVFVVGCQLFYDRARTLPWNNPSVCYVFLNHPNNSSFYPDGSWWQINASGEIISYYGMPGG